MQDRDERLRTLADIFLIILEQKYEQEEQKEYVRKVRTLMDVPECAELLSCSLVNAMGYPTPIAENTVDKAVDCLIHFHEDNIENKKDLNKTQKITEKGAVNNFMNECRIALKRFIASRNLLIR